MTTPKSLSAPREKRTGRPPKDKSEAHYRDTELHRFLYPRLRLVPGMTKGDRIDARAMARGAGVAQWTVYRWFKNGLSARAVRPIVNLSKTPKHPNGTVKAEQLAPFIKF